MQQQQQQSGFTLIELIIVIVILGILAVTAAPKFIDIQGDATASTLKGVKGALQGGSQLVYAKSAIASDQRKPDTTLTTGGQVVPTRFGYPAADATVATTLDNLLGWVDISTEFTLDVGAGTAATASPAAGTFAIKPAGGNPTVDYTVITEGGNSCHVLYTEASGDGSTPQIFQAAPIVTVVTGGC